jgi:crossover junction endodeoxyribonuclease RuvC
MRFEMGEPLSYAGPLAADPTMPRYSTRSWRAFRPDAAAITGAGAARVATAAPAALGPTRVLGLDPGSRRTGFGVIDCCGTETVYVSAGCIEVDKLPVAERLRRIHLEMRRIVESLAPDAVAVERVFVNRNADSALKLGQARGAALAAIESGTVLHEYAPRAVKLAVVGTGSAEKTQVAHMVAQLLALAEPPVGDAADALAIALCHAHHRRLAALAGALPRGMTA